VLRLRVGQGSSLDGRALVAGKVKRLVQMDGIFPGGGPAFTNQKIDLESANAVVGGEGWPTPIAWVDAPTLLYAIGDLLGAFSEQGQGGAAVAVFPIQSLSRKR
jgi:hypothetical protein